MVRSSECSERERIGDADRRPSKVALGQPQPPRKAGVGEAQADHGVEAQIPHHVLGAAAQHLLAAESPALAGCLRQGGRKVLVVAVNATHLLHQVGLAADVVVAVDGNLGHQVVALALDPEAEPLQVRRAQLGRDPHPEQRVGAPRAQPHSARSRQLGGGVDRPGHQLRPAHLDHQLRRDALGADRQLGVKLLLEPVGRLRAQPQLSRGAQDVHPVPGRGLEQHPGGRARRPPRSGRP